MTLSANTALLLIDVQQGLDHPRWGGSPTHRSGQTGPATRSSRKPPPNRANPSSRRP
jgi:nicotinamidase-related amidase